MQLLEILQQAVGRRASDILIIGGLPVSYKVREHIFREGERLLPDDTAQLVSEIYDAAGGRPMEALLAAGDDDFSFSVPGLSRFRVNTFKQRGSLAAVIRVVTFTLPDRREIGIPDAVMSFADLTKGMVLVTGPAGSGKSTTLACMLDRINREREGHIITIEDPIEYLHRHNRSVVTQRELSTDTCSYDAALRAALRQSPDVIFLGEMRDYETIKAAITAAETGHLVVSTLHTIGAANTIDRIIDAFPPAQQQQIRVQLAGVLQGVVSQQLLPTVRGDIVPAFEIMRLNSAIRTMIREAKLHQVESVILSGAKEGMVTMDTSLKRLYDEGVISRETAVRYSTNPERMEAKV